VIRPSGSYLNDRKSVMPEPNDKPAVGWIGLGDQGTPMAQAIADNGYPLHVWARRPESLKALDGHILMMMNHKNALDVLRLANSLDLPIPALLQVLLSGSASSYALQAIGPSVTSGNVHHLVPLELIDLGLFSGAVAALGDAAGRSSTVPPPAPRNSTS
jgi:3-hydroxyisobutyrate dehydrogenase-like beta-hydroxyacid dehydrogenase